MSDNDDLVERGLRAWSAGDVAAIESLLHPDVTLRWVEPGPWDCEGRDEVLRELQRVQEQRGSRAPEAVAERVDESAYVVRLPERDEVATRILVEGGLVVSLQQFSTAPEGDDVSPVVRAIRRGDVDDLRALLAADPELVGSRPAGYGGRTLLHIATDWPGHLPRVAEVIAVLVAAGADVDGALGSPHEEGPLHWAASSDDVAALDALLDAGASIDLPGAVIGGGTPLNDATAFAQWAAARRLVERGARLSPFDAAALGQTEELRRLLVVHPEESLDALLWGACHGGQRETAEHLVGLGADPTWLGWDELTPIGAAERAGAPELAAWLRDQRPTGS